jgi:hypothetical protein
VVRGGFGISVDPDNMRNQRNQFPNTSVTSYTPANQYQFISYAGVPNSDGATQVSLSDGIPLPSFPNLSAGTLKPSPTASLSTYLPNQGTTTFPAYMNRGYYQSWNITLQRDFSSTLNGQLAYVGTHGVHIDMNVNINGAAPNTGNAGRQLYPYDTADINSVEPFGDMTYNGLQASLRKRIGSSVIGASYAFSRSIDDINGDNNDGSLWRAYPVSFALDKQLSGINRQQTLNIYWVYNLPFGKGHTMLTHGAGALIAGGWQISGILSRFSGLPFTVGTSSSVNAGGQGASATQINPAVQILGGHDANTPYFDGSAFVNPPTGVLGTTGRNLLIGPGYFQLNASIRRTFAFKSEKIKFELVGEAYNLTNTVVFSNPNATCCWVTNATTGAINYNNFAVITGTASTQRYIEVGGYLRF